MNHVALVGVVNSAPELRVLPSGKHITQFLVKTRDIINGEWRDEFHAVIAWGRIADVTAQYLTDNDAVVVEGRIQTRSWEDDRGMKHHRTEVVAESVSLQPRARLYRNMLAEVRA